MKRSTVTKWFSLFFVTLILFSCRPLVNSTLTVKKNGRFDLVVQIKTLTSDFALVGMTPDESMKSFEALFDKKQTRPAPTFTKVVTKDDMTTVEVTYRNMTSSKLQQLLGGKSSIKAKNKGYSLVLDLKFMPQNAPVIVEGFAEVSFTISGGKDYVLGSVSGAPNSITDNSANWKMSTSKNYLVEASFVPPPHAGHVSADTGFPWAYLIIGLLVLVIGIFVFRKIRSRKKDGDKKIVVENIDDDEYDNSDDDRRGYHFDDDEDFVQRHGPESMRSRHEMFNERMGYERRSRPGRLEWDDDDDEDDEDE